MSTALEDLARRWSIEPVGTVPAAPHTLEETGLSAETVSNLLLKTLYVQGPRTGQQLSDFVCLAFPLLDEVLLPLQLRRMIEVRGASGHGRAGYTFDLAGPGRERAREAMDQNQYVGAAPVPLSVYERWLDEQSVRRARVTRARLEEELGDAVVGSDMLEELGPAINSGRSVFLFGPPGNGKTMIAEAIARTLGSVIYLPHAVEIDGQIVLVYDPVYHLSPDEVVPDALEPTEEAADSIWRRRESGYDRRFVRVRRPVVVAGGELTLDQLDLKLDESTRVYRAPFQMKANGGVLIIDDFGRQRVPPHQLLNRWIVPLERGVDFLTLHTGSKFPVRFDCLLVFSTNLDLHNLADEAFLRRIQYKIAVGNPSRGELTEIFRRACHELEIAFQDGAVELLFRDYYDPGRVEPRACHPRSILQRVLDITRYRGVPPHLSEELVRAACRSYFVELSDGER